MICFADAYSGRQSDHLVNMRVHHMQRKGKLTALLDQSGTQTNMQSGPLGKPNWEIGVAIG